MYAEGRHTAASINSLGVMPVNRSSTSKLLSAAILLSLAAASAQAANRSDLHQRNIQQLRQQYRRGQPLRVFYQVWDRPLYTLGGRQVVSDALALIISIFFVVREKRHLYGLLNHKGEASLMPS